MQGNLGESWLKWAVELEEEASCDVEAGLDLGQNLGNYIAKTQPYINHEKLMSVLLEELGAILSQEELEVIAKNTESSVREYIQKKLHHFDVA